MTASWSGQIIRWNLNDGSLISTNACPWDLKDDAVERLISVYYDQALCVIVRQPNHLLKVVVGFFPFIIC